MNGQVSAPPTDRLSVLPPARLLGEAFPRRSSIGIRERHAARDAVPSQKRSPHLDGLRGRLVNLQVLSDLTRTARGLDRGMVRYVGLTLLWHLVWAILVTLAYFALFFVVFGGEAAREEYLNWQLAGYVVVVVLVLLTSPVNTSIAAVAAVWSLSRTLRMVVAALIWILVIVVLMLVLGSTVDLALVALFGLAGAVFGAGLPDYRKDMRGPVEPWSR